MSLRDTVLAALDGDAPRSSADIAEDTGLESRQVGNCLNQMQSDGKCKRVAEGWIRTGSDTPPQAPTTPTAVAPPRSVREPKAKPVKRAAKRTAVTVAKPKGNGHDIPVFTKAQRTAAIPAAIPPSAPITCRLVVVDYVGPSANVGTLIAGLKEAFGAGR